MLEFVYNIFVFEENKNEGHESQHRPVSFFEGDEWTLPSERSFIADAAEAVEKRLQHLGWKDEEIGLFPIIVDEALANAVIHGNLEIKRLGGESFDDYQARIQKAEQGAEAKKKHIRVSLNLTPDDATITVTDEGRGFVLSDVPDPTNKERLLEPSGRGIDLIKKVCDRVTFLPNGIILYKIRQV